MNEELLKVIVQLFAVVAKERITEAEKENLRDFLAIHVSHDTIPYYLSFFEEHVENAKRANVDLQDADDVTLEYIDDWANIMQMCKKINEGLTRQQKIVLLLKLIELMLQDGIISERQSNLIYYIGEVINVKQNDINSIQQFLVAEDPDEIDTQQALIIDAGLETHEYKSKHIVRPNITGLIVILRIPDADTYFIKYLGISALSLNGSNLRSRKSYVFPTGSTVRGSKMQPVYYSDIVGKFMSGDDHTKLSFEAKSITYKFKSGATGLHEINIAEEGGKLIGLMGASGSGKSTLLSVLNGSERPTTGKIIINGIDLYKKPEWLEGVVGFVPQDDFLIEELTVYENLYYAARLCFGQHTEEETNKLVMHTLRSLGLSETKDLRVGSTLDKTISGGQRKRLNIGLELLRQPTILFVDEPTSGLSSRDSVNIMDLLKELSLRGKMVFVVIHQPPSDIFKMFDSLVILDVGGYQVYYGNPVEALVYFKTLVNMVNKDQGACIECGNVNSEQILDILESRVVNEYGRFTDRRKIPAEEWYQFYKQYHQPPVIDYFSDKIRTIQKIPGRIRQTKIYGIRDIKTKIKNKQYLLITFFEAPVLALFLYFLIKYYTEMDGSLTYIFAQNENIPVYFFMAVIVSLFMGLTLSAEEIIKDRKILKRESFLNLSKASYLGSKISILFAISAVQSLSFVLIGNAVLELQEMNFNMWMILFATSCFANMLGLNISSAFNSAVTVYILIPLLLIPQIILSGVIVKFDSFNPKISSVDNVPLIGDMMASRWAFEALSVTQFKRNPYGDIHFNVDQEIALKQYKKVYYMPVLHSHLSTVRNGLFLNDSLTDQKVFVQSLAVLKNEIGKELKVVGARQLPTYINLTPELVDSTVVEQTSAFLYNLDKFYARRLGDKQDLRNDMVKEMTKTPQRLAQYEQLKNEYHNIAISDMVTRKNSIKRISEVGDNLVMTATPVYHRPDVTNWFDFRTTFYAAYKGFFGITFDTLIFNVAMLWFMSFGLIIALYYEWLRKLVEGIGNFQQNRKYKRMMQESEKQSQLL
jgi:ABC-type multidrug transport system ATPase subunit